MSLFQLVDYQAPHSIHNFCRWTISPRGLHTHSNNYFCTDMPYAFVPEIWLIGPIMPIYTTAGDKYIRTITILAVISDFEEL